MKPDLSAFTLRVFRLEIYNPAISDQGSVGVFSSHIEIAIQDRRLNHDNFIAGRKAESLAIMSNARKSFALRMLDPSLIIAGVLTVSFYALISQPAFADSLIQRYTMAHLVDYVIVTLWIWGLTDITLRVIGFPRELLAVREYWLAPKQGKEPVEMASNALKSLQERPRWQRESRIGKRLISALEYVHQKGSAEDFREHLQHLALQDEDTTYSNYSLPRFIIAVTPVLGFLGTVVHFGTALSGISFEEMAAKLPHVVSEMGQAFNTTTTALAAAMSMMFILFLCERVEKGFIQQIDRYSELELLNRYEVKAGELSPFLRSIQESNDQALSMIAETLNKHTGLWLAAFSEILQQFDNRQQQDTNIWRNALAEMGQQQQKHDATRESKLQEMIETLDERQTKLLGNVDATITKALTLRESISELVVAVNSVQQGEGKLAEVQQSLSKNLRLIHETQKIDEALHGLTGAIHLLTARHRGSDDHSDRIAA